MCSKKDYIVIADIVSDARAKHKLSGAARLIEVTARLADYFASENPNFDRNKFMLACLPADGSIGSRKV
jgi:hypothetical protein